MREVSIEDLKREIQLLRDQTARLISEKLELQRQLEELKRENADIPIEAVAAAAVRAARSAEQTIAEQIPEGNRYIVPQLETSLRGFVVERDGALSLRLPFPEHAVPPGLLGRVQMTVAQIPPARMEPAPDVFSATPQLISVLERAQTAFAAWQLRRGASAARQFLDGTIRLLSAHPRWKLNELNTELQTLSEATTKLTTALSKQPSSKTLQSRAAGREFRDLVQSLMKSNRITNDDMDRLSASIERILEAYPTGGKRTEHKKHKKNTRST